ncbi:MAG TPA: hypothetical protein VK501_16830 [Baekduia sp.]|uniref:hypothetical protein n=1 Tax=Baekduia sp. TaxID=2600305 RepID=UPI002BC8C15A|nr:hypothetical protein [Baekduia sp.]HMJ35576.1 hypothetical protein [Baekduia sp.]
MRRTLTAVVLLLAGVLPAVAVASWWAYGEATDTERFLETARPLSTDATVQRAVADELVAAANAELGSLPVPVPGGTTALRAQVRSIAERLVASSAYRESFLAVLRTTHARLVARLEGDVDARLTMDLGRIATVLRARVRAAGLPAEVADAIRDPAPVVLADRAEMRRTRDATDRIRIVRAFSIPGAIVALLLVALTAPGLASGVLRVAACLAVSTLLLVAAWLVARAVIAADSSSRDLALAVYDVLTRPLRGWVIGGTVGAVALAAVGGGLRVAHGARVDRRP